jgi:hypothetical protein
MWSAAWDSVGDAMKRLTFPQIEAIAQAYCLNRFERDGAIFNWQEKIEMAAILADWYYALESVIGPSREMIKGDL